MSEESVQPTQANYTITSNLPFDLTFKLLTEEGTYAPYTILPGENPDVDYALMQRNKNDFVMLYFISVGTFVFTPELN
jgi:hypothetical protein